MSPCPNVKLCCQILHQWIYVSRPGLSSSSIHPLLRLHRPTLHNWILQTSVAKDCPAISEDARVYQPWEREAKKKKKKTLQVNFICHLSGRELSDSGHSFIHKVNPQSHSGWGQDTHSGLGLYMNMLAGTAFYCFYSISMFANSWKEWTWCMVLWVFISRVFLSF